MAGKFSSHIRSNVVGYIALFFALGLGSAWAATELDKNEVKSKHIGKGQVKTKDLGKNAVTSPKVADGSLLSDDFAPGQLPKGEKGDSGEPGQPGAPGQPGQPGSPAASAFTGRIDALQDADGLPTFALSEGRTPLVAVNDRSNMETLSPNATIVARDLAVEITLPEGNEGGGTFTLIDDGNPTPVSCSVAATGGGSPPGGETLTCDSGTQTAVIAPKSHLALRVSGNENNELGGLTVQFGWRATTP